MLLGIKFTIKHGPFDDLVDTIVWPAVVEVGMVMQPSAQPVEFQIVNLQVGGDTSEDSFQHTQVVLNLGSVLRVTHLFAKPEDVQQIVVR